MEVFMIGCIGEYIVEKTNTTDDIVKKIKEYEKLQIQDQRQRVQR